MRFDEAAYRVFLDALCEGLTIDAAANEANLSPRTIDGRRQRDPGFADIVDQILTATGCLPTVRRSATGRSTVLTPAARSAVVRALRRGSTLREAALEAGLTPQAIKRGRYLDSAFDAAVVRAGTAAGRPFKRLVKPPCPGPKCGTPYGYDVLGCRAGACKAHKVAAVTARRNQ